MVQDVECLGPELKVDSLLEGRVFGQREVDVGKARSFDDVASGVAETSRMADECRLVEEQFRVRVIQLDGLAGNEIGTIECEQAAASVRQQRDDGTEWLYSPEL